MIDDWKKIFPELQPDPKIWATVLNGRVIFGNAEFHNIETHHGDVVITRSMVPFREFWYRGVTLEQAKEQIREILLEVQD